MRLKTSAAILAGLVVSAVGVQVRQAENAGLLATQGLSAPLQVGGGALPVGTDVMGDAQRLIIQRRIDQNISALTRAGRIAAPQALPATMIWPLRATSSVTDYGFAAVTNFVDHNVAVPNQIRDYACGTRSYDLASGYNHAGTDIMSFPFPWLKMSRSQVEIIAAAAGVIVDKSDGNFDRNCGLNSSNWNAVYVRHSDGSIAWYGHMKSGSLTPKAIGASVAAGEYLGAVGSSGSSTAPHLHFELHTASGVLVDPFQGSCNQPPSGSWWQSQPPYPDRAVQALTTGSRYPDMGTCPGEESPNLQTVFSPQSLIYLTAYYREQGAGHVTSYALRRPDGTAYMSWSHTSPGDYRLSYWFFLASLPATPLGMWRFEATYLGSTYATSFRLGSGFTDPTIASGSLPIKAVHITELRERIDGIRARWGLSSFSWTDPTLSAGVTMIKSVHISELRAALNAAYDRAQRSRPAFSANIIPGTGSLTGAAIAELRTAITDIE